MKDRPATRFNTFVFRWFEAPKNKAIWRLTDRIDRLINKLGKG